MVNLFPGDKVLVQSGAGGVGTALIQYAKHKGCIIFATAGSPEKIIYLKECGVDHPINYKTTDFEEEIRTITHGKGVDVVFDAVGGASVRKGIKLLNAGGRMVCYGASDFTSKNALRKLASGLAFGIYHPAMLMMPSKAIIGVNMLRIADNKPQTMKRCLAQVVALTKQGVFRPMLGKVFPISEIGAAHDYVEKRKSIGKVAVQW
jgi:NADPH2:quinone reductase